MSSELFYALSFKTSSLNTIIYDSETLRVFYPYQKLQKKFSFLQYKKFIKQGILLFNKMLCVSVDFKM